MKRGRLMAGAACAALLAACVVVVPRPQPPRAPPSAHADLLLATERGMGSIVFDAHRAWLALSNSATGASAVLHSGAIVNRASRWEPIDLGVCALGPARADQPRAPALTRVEGKIYLFQPSSGSPDEHALCQLERASEWFAPRDQGLRVCARGACERLWMTDLQAWRGQLFANAGAGLNVLASGDEGRSWRALLGGVVRHSCTHAAFRIVNERLLVGGECPRDVAYLRAWPLAPDGVSLASDTPLPLALPALENRNVQLIRSVGQSIFAAVEGGLLRSTDQGRSFQFVIRHAPDAAHYPAIGHLLGLRNRPDLILAAGVDRANGKPYLVVSRDGGAGWTDLSAVLPGHDRPDGAAELTSLAQDQVGRILLTLNLAPAARGRLLLLTLAGLD